MIGAVLMSTLMALGVFLVWGLRSRRMRRKGEHVGGASGKEESAVGIDREGDGKGGEKTC